MTTIELNPYLKAHYALMPSQKEYIIQYEVAPNNCSFGKNIPDALFFAQVQDFELFLKNPNDTWVTSRSFYTHSAIHSIWIEDCPSVTYVSSSGGFFFGSEQGLIDLWKDESLRSSLNKLKFFTRRLDLHFKDYFNGDIDDILKGKVTPFRYFSSDIVDLSFSTAFFTPGFTPIFVTPFCYSDSPLSPTILSTLFKINSLYLNNYPSTNCTLFNNNTFLCLVFLHYYHTKDETISLSVLKQYDYILETFKRHVDVDNLEKYYQNYMLNKQLTIELPSLDKIAQCKI